MSGLALVLSIDGAADGALGFRETVARGRGSFDVAATTPDDPALRSGERDLRCDDVESGDDATRERAAEHRRGAVDRVALRHASRA